MKMLFTFIPMFVSRFISTTFILWINYWVLLACVEREKQFTIPSSNSRFWAQALSSCSSLPHVEGCEYTNFQRFFIKKDEVDEDLLHEATNRHIVLAKAPWSYNWNINLLWSFKILKLMLKLKAWMSKKS
jgi:hypothetical protein